MARTAAKFSLITRSRHLSSRLNRFFISGLLFTILASLAYVYLQNPFTAEAGWWNDSWAYRKKIIITKTSAAQTAVYVAFDAGDVLDTSDTTAFQGDCGDIRFIKQNGEPLPYYINSGCSTASTDIDVYFDSIPLGSNVIYMYYGNPSVANGFNASGFATEATNYTIGTPGSQEAGNTPILHWSLNDDSGTTVKDSTVHNNDGTRTNGVIQPSEQCVVGKCVYLDGTGDFLSKVNDDDLNFSASQSFSISLWFKTNDASGVALVEKNTGSNQGYAIRLQANGEVEFMIGDGTNTDTITTSGSAYNNNQWYHLVAVKNGTTGTYLYINGQLVGSDTSLSSTGSLSNTSTFYVGVDYDGAGEDLAGFIDEIKVYRTAISADHVKMLYSNPANNTSAGGTLPTHSYSLSSNLVLYLPMEDKDIDSHSCPLGGSGDVCDASGYGNHGLDNGSMTDSDYAEGRFGYGLIFDGTNDYISVVNSDSLDFGTGSLTWSAWFKTTASGDNAILSYNNDGGGSYRLRTLVDNSGNIEWGLYNGSSWDVSYDTSQDYADGNWHHIAIVWDRTGDAKLFMNGQITDTLDISSYQGLSLNDAAINIGDDSDHASSEFEGNIDEVRIYNTALSSNQVVELYNWTAPPIVYLDFDQNTGTSTVYDRSGKANNGTMAGSMTEADWVPGRFGSALDFDGSNDEVNITGTNDMITPTGTYMMWVYPRAVPSDDWGSSWVSYDDNDGDSNHAIMFNYTPNQGLLARARSASEAYPFQYNYYSYDNVVPLNTWTHIAVVQDGTAPKIFVNGTDQTSWGVGDNTAYWLHNPGLKTLSVNNSTGTGHLNAIIDDFKMYNYPRTPAQIVEDMNASHPLGGSPISSPFIHYRLDEAQGTTVYNANPQYQNLTATNNGAVWLPPSTCRINTCLHLDTTTDNLDANDPSQTDKSSQLSLSLWLNPQSLATSRAIISKDAASHKHFALITDSSNSDELRFYVASSLSDTSNYVTTTNADLATSTWQHISVVYDGDASADQRVKIYKDGRRLNTSTTGTIPIITTAGHTSDIRVGQSSDGGYSALLGYYDEIKIYTGALTAQEVLIDYNAGSSAAMGGVLGNQEIEQLSGGAGDPPVLYWSFNENTGTTVRDLSNNDNDGTVTGATFAPGKIGSAMRFSTTNTDRVVKITPNNIPANNAAQSFAYWYKLDANPTGPDVAVNVLGSGASALQCGIRSSTVRCWKNGGTAVVDSGALPAIRTWHHVVFTTTGSAHNIYVNGQLLGTASTSLDTGTADNVEVGYNGDSTTEDWENGEIDEVKIWDYALSTAQVMYDYNRGQPIAWYRLDECQGNTAYDASGHGLTGTITIGGTGDYTASGSCGSGTSTHAWNAGTTGKLNSALGFDGTDDYISVTHNTRLNLTSGLSLAAWVNILSQKSNNVIISKGASYEMGINATGSIYWDGVGDEVNEGTNSIDTDTWYHVALTNDDTTARYYLNGQLLGTSSSGIDANNSTTFYLGYDGTNYFHGLLDDVRIYNYVLSASQLLQVMKGGAVNFGPSQGSP